MTAKPNTRRKDTGVLEDILATVRSIDHGVEEVMDKVEDCLNCLRYDPAWEYGGRPGEGDAY